MSNLRMHQEKGAIVVEFYANSILDPAQIESIGKELFSIADQSANSTLVVDLRNVELLSSALIGVLIRFKMRVRKKGSRLTLCNASDDLMELLRVTKLDSVFDIHESRSDAIAAL